jgi:hypothetical protein
MTTITNQEGSLQAKIPKSMIQRVRIEGVQRGVKPRDIVMEALEMYFAARAKATKETRRAS